MKPRLVPCPICGALSAFDPANPYRPFCSKRCKLIDLGQWASEAYGVPSSEPPEPGEPPREPES